MVRYDPRPVLIIDDGKESARVEELFKQRKVEYRTMHVDSLQEVNKCSFAPPTFIVTTRGDSYIGFEEIRGAVRRNEYF